jgi:hypothetical protein
MRARAAEKGLSPWPDVGLRVVPAGTVRLLPTWIGSLAKPYYVCGRHLNRNHPFLASQIGAATRCPGLSGTCKRGHRWGRSGGKPP